MKIRETYCQIATKTIKDIKEIRDERREEMWSFPPLSFN
jgi:hypothetical protein